MLRALVHRRIHGVGFTSATAIDPCACHRRMEKVVCQSHVIVLDFESASERTSRLEAVLVLSAAANGAETTTLASSQVLVAARDGKFGRPERNMLSFFLGSAPGAIIANAVCRVFKTSHLSFYLTTSHFR